MKKYKLKSVIIEAMQFDGSLKSAEVFREYLQKEKSCTFVQIYKTDKEVGLICDFRSSLSREYIMKGVYLLKKTLPDKEDPQWEVLWEREFNNLYEILT